MKFTGSDVDWSDEFGYSVGISADAAIVGAWLNGDAGIYSGAAYLFNSEPADTDSDGDVDTADLTTMFQNFTGDVGSAGGKTGMQGDTDLDGDVDTADLTAGFQSFTGDQSTSIPEPSSLVLLVLGLTVVTFCWILRR